jgi:hypothetical protein
VDEPTGILCVAQRNDMGSWSAYVAVMPGHVWHGRSHNYGDDDEENALPPVPAVDAHGGLSWSGPGDFYRCFRADRARFEGAWFIGFDFGHSWDIQPRMLKYDDELQYSSDMRKMSSYKTLEYVKKECARVAEQLKAIGNK